MSGASNHLAVTAAVTIVAGIGCQMVARKLRIPAIIPLLLFGIVLGPDVLGWVRPDEMGDGLRVVVGLAVAVILFEGGLTLKTEAFRFAGVAIQRLVGWGALLTWVLAAAAAYVLFPDLGAGPAALFGSLVIVTGPTVIQPLLHAVRPRKRVADILRGEGILIDPVGALYAVLVLEFLNPHEVGDLGAFGAFGLRVLTGAGVGAGGAFLLDRILRRGSLAPDLRNLVVLAGAIGLYTLAESLLSESGVLAVTLAGFVLGWLHPPGIEEIEEFKGHMTMLMVSAVFILLSADLGIGEVLDLGWRGLALVLAIILLIRPITIFLCTIKTDLLTNEKLFLSWIAPRGIVAAAVSSLFALILLEAGQPEGVVVRNLVFAVILATVVVQGLTAGWVARLLGVVEEGSDGFLIVGANVVGRRLGRALHRAGHRVVLVDTNRWRVQSAVEEGLAAHRADVLDELSMEAVDFDGIGNLLCVTPNDGVNRLAERLHAGYFGAPNVRSIRLRESPSREGLATGWLFGERLGWEELSRKLESGFEIQKAEVDEAVGVQGFGELIEGAVPLLAFESSGKARFLADDDELVVGESVFYLTRAES